jgi:hypothetical protein
MLDIKFKDIQRLRFSFDLNYKSYNINVEQKNIYKIEVNKIIKDKDYNDALLDFINIMLKPYINLAIDDIEKINNNIT